MGAACPVEFYMCILDAISDPYFNSGALKTLCRSRNPAKKDHIWRHATSWFENWFNVDELNFIKQTLLDTHRER